MELVDLDALFERSDFLSVNCPLNDATLGLVDAARFSQMKDSAYVYCYCAPPSKSSLTARACMIVWRVAQLSTRVCRYVQQATDGRALPACW